MRRPRGGSHHILSIPRSCLGQDSSTWKFRRLAYRRGHIRKRWLLIGVYDLEAAVYGLVHGRGNRLMGAPDRDGNFGNGRSCLNSMTRIITT
jgi:hypothetical protein